MVLLIFRMLDISQESNLLNSWRFVAEWNCDGSFWGLMPSGGIGGVLSSERVYLHGDEVFESTEGCVDCICVFGTLVGDGDGSEVCRDDGCNTQCRQLSNYMGKSLRRIGNLSNMVRLYLLRGGQ